MFVPFGGTRKHSSPEAVVYNDEQGGFHTFDFGEWADFSEEEPSDESIATVSFRLRFRADTICAECDRFPKRVKFTRHNILSATKTSLPILRQGV